MPEEHGIQELNKSSANLIANKEAQVFTEFCHFQRLFPVCRLADKKVTTTSFSVAQKKY